MPGSASGSLGGSLEEGFYSGVLRLPEQWPLSPMNLWPLTIHFLCALFLRNQGLSLEDGPSGDTTRPPTQWP